jgi:excisionase family DNA binding protein
MDSNEQILIGAPAIADHLGVKQRQVYRLIADGVLPTFKLGGSVAVRRSTLANWLAKLEAGTDNTVAERAAA